MSTNDGLRQASVRSATGTAYDYNGDWMALFDLAAIPKGHFNGRLLAWINATLGASYSEINGAMTAFAVSQGVINWNSLGTFIPGAVAALLTDFVAGTYFVGGQFYPDFLSMPGASFTRASVGTATWADGHVSTFASGVPRITDLGLLIEESRTNLLLNSATLATQTVTTAAASYTLSFTGTGTVTLSGTCSGTLVGTGALTVVSLTVTATAGSCTATVSGTVTDANLEAGAFGTSWIPTTAAAATRAADSANITAPGLAFPMSLSGSALLGPPSSSGASATLGGVTDGTTNNRFLLIVNNVPRPAMFTISGGVSVANVATPTPFTTNQKVGIAAAASTNDYAIYDSGGGSNAATTAGALPVGANIVQLGIGSTPLNSYLRRLAVYSGRLSNAKLQALAAQP